MLPINIKVGCILNSSLKKKNIIKIATPTIIVINFSIIIRGVLLLGAPNRAHLKIKQR